MSEFNSGDLNKDTVKVIMMLVGKLSHCNANSNKIQQKTDNSNYPLHFKANKLEIYEQLGVLITLII